MATLELVRVDRSERQRPDGRAALRLTGLVRLGAQPPMPIWYEVDEAHADALATGADPWLACLLPLAVQRGVPLVVHAPVDPLALDHAHALMDIWHAWDPRHRPITIAAPTRAPEAAGSRTASFFSGGVDSFFSALRTRALPIDDLLLVHGAWDLPVAEEAGFGRVEARLESVARALGKALVVVRSNVFATRLAATDVERHSLGAIMASVALALARRWHHVLVPASTDLGWLGPWGSHPLTDPLLSTSATRLAADGIAHARFARTAAIVASDQAELALSALRVCLRTGDETNCGRCEKCLRTMVALELLGAGPRARTFPPLGLAAVATARVIGPAQRYAFIELQAEARRRGRPDLAAGIGLALVRSHAHDALRPVARGVRAALALRPRRG